MVSYHFVLCFLASLCLMIALTHAAAPVFTISTHAGTAGSYGYSGDGGMAINAKFNIPQGVAVLPTGEVYVADSKNNVIRLVSNGIISTFAGTGTASFSGDGDVAVNATLNNPQEFSIDPLTFDLFVADTWNYKVRKISQGIITSVVGSGQTGYSVAGTQALSADFKYICGVAFSPMSGELYFADSFNYLIRKVSNMDGSIVDIAGIAQTLGSGPYGGLGNTVKMSATYQMAVSPLTGDIYLTTANNNVILKVIADSGVVVVFAGTGDGGYSGDGGLAVNARLNNPIGVAVSANGEVYIADSANNVIRKVDNNGVITTIAGTGTPGYSGDGSSSINATLNNPVSIAIRNIGSIYELYVAEYNSHIIRKLSGFCEDSNQVLVNGVCEDQCFGILNQNPNVCSGRGVCASYNNCTCNSGYYGSNCESFQCFGVDSQNTTVCSGNGVCQDKDTCVCKNGFSGNNCELFSCFNVSSLNSNVCSGRGSCLQTDTCKCNSGYYGSNCESFNCNGVDSQNTTVCSGNGVCQDKDSCICKNGFSGNNCELFSCFNVSSLNSNVCSGRGSCLQIDTCKCNPGSTGSNCEVITCNGYRAGDIGVCSSRGACVAPNRCACQSGFNGSNCENYYCNGFLNNESGVCSGLGVCGAPEVCTCVKGYYGANCEYTSDALAVSYNISTVVGTGVKGYNGDNILATQAFLNLANTIAIWGNSYYIADSGNNRIRKVSNGIITTIAGNGSPKFGGDGGVATNASLYYPSTMAFNSIGELYIADFNNYRIRKISVNGVISTVAGNGVAAYRGDGGLAINAGFNGPYGVSVDSNGDFYVTDSVDCVVRKVTISTGIISTVVGSGNTGYNGDGILATNANLNSPSGICFGKSNEMYIADNLNYRIRKVVNGIISTVCGTGVSGYSGDGGLATNATIGQVNALSCFNGEIFFADVLNNRVRKISASGIITTIAGTGRIGSQGDGGPALKARFNLPVGVALNSTGHIWVADIYNYEIRFLTGQCNYPYAFVNGVCLPQCNGLTNYDLSVCSGHGSCLSSNNCTCTSGFYGSNCQNVTSPYVSASLKAATSFKANSANSLLFSGLLYGIVCLLYILTGF